MAPKLSRELRRELSATRMLGGEQASPFLVITKPGDFSATLLEFGGEVTSAFETIHAYRVMLTPAQALNLAKAPWVKTIERDGDARALEPD